MGSSLQVYEVWRLRGRRVWVLAKNPTMVALWNCRCKANVPDRVFFSTKTKVWPVCPVCKEAEVDAPPLLNRLVIPGSWSAFAEELYAIGHLEAA